MGLTKAAKSTVNAGITSPWTGVLDDVKRRKQATYRHPSLPPDSGCHMRYTDHLPHAHSSMTRSPQTVSQKSFLASLLPSLSHIAGYFASARRKVSNTDGEFGGPRTVVLNLLRTATL